MLCEWVKQHLLPRPSAPGASAAALPRLPAGDPSGIVLRAGRAADGFTLDSQYMHKAVLMLLHETEGRLVIGAVRSLSPALHNRGRQVAPISTRITTPLQPLRRSSIAPRPTWCSSTCRAVLAAALGLVARRASEVAR